MQRGPFEASSDPVEIAAGWVERLTAGDASDRDIAELRAWVAADPLNRQAYEAARAAWTALPVTRLRRRNLRFVPWGGALAAAVAAAVIFLPISHDYQTRRGQVSEMRLPDGTVAWLDGNSAIDVDMGSDRREVTVARGRVAFKVAKDARPFSVAAADATVTDIGTEFSVDRDGALHVAVREGEVEVAKDGERTRLKAGEGAKFDEAGVQRLSVAADRFAWRSGRIVLDAVPLRQALQELDRYYPGTIELADASLASRRVSGTLFIGNPREGLETIARSQHLKLSRFLWITRVSPESD